MHSVLTITTTGLTLLAPMLVSLLNMTLALAIMLALDPLMLVALVFLAPILMTLVAIDPNRPPQLALTFRSRLTTATPMVSS